MKLFVSSVTALISPLISTLPPFVVSVVFASPISTIELKSSDKVQFVDEIFAFNTVVVALKVNVAFLAPE